MATIPNNTNLDSVIESMEKNSTIMDKIVKIVFSGTKSLDKINMSDLKNKVKQANKISGMLVDYLNSVNLMLSTLQETSNMNVDTILGHTVDESVNKGKVVKKDKYTNLEAIQQLGGVFNSITSSLKTLDGLKTGFFAVKDMQKKIRVFGQLFQNVLIEVSNMFRNMDTSKFSSITDLLIGDPEIVEQSINQHGMDPDNITNETSKDIINSIIKSEKSKTTKGRPGLIDTLLKVFDLIKFISDYQIPKRSLLRKKLNSISSQVTAIIGLVYGIAAKYGTEDMTKKMKSFLEVLEGDSGLQDVISDVVGLNNDILKMSDKTSKDSELKITNTFLCIDTAIDYMFEILNKESTRKLADEDLEEVISGLNRNTNSFMKIINTILKSSTMLILIAAMSQFISYGIEALKVFITKSVEVIKFLELLNVTGNNINILNNIIETINEVVNKFIKFGLLSIAFNAILPSIILGLLSMKVILTMLKNIISKELINNLGNNIDGIITIFERIETLSRLKINEKKANKAIKSGVKILLELVNIYNDISIDEKNLKKINGVFNIINDTLNIFKKIAVLGIYAIPVMFTSIIFGTKIFGKTALSLTKNLIEGVVNIYSDLDDKKVKLANDNSNNILIILGNTISVFIGIIGLGVLAIGVIAAAVPAIIGVTVARVVFGAISIFFKTIKLSKEKEERSDAVLAIVNNMVDVFKGLIFIGLFAVPVILLSPIIIAGLLVARLLIGGINLVLKIMIKSTKHVKKATIYIVLIGLVMLAIAGLCLLIIKTTEVTLNTFIAMAALAVAFIGMMLMLSIMLWIAKKVTANKQSFKAIFLIGLVIGGLLLLSYMIIKLLEVAKGIGKQEFLDILLLFLLITMIGAFTTGLGFLCSLILPVIPAVLLGLGALFVMIGAILLIAGELKLIEMLNLNESKINDNIKAVFNSIENIVKSIFGFGDNNNEETTDDKFMDVIFKLGGVFLTYIGAFLSIPFLATAVVSIGLILLIAGQLKLIEFIELDGGKITSNIDTVIDAARQVSEAIFNNNKNDKLQDKQNKETGLWAKFKGVVKDIFNGSGIRNLVGIIGSIPFLATSVMAIGLMVSLAESLKKLSEIQLTTNAIDANVETVISTAKSVSDKIFDKNWKVPSKKTMQAKIDILTAINTLIKESVIISDKEANNNKKVVDNYIKFIDKIDKCKVENLKSTAKVFEKMAEFSESINGNFEKLADTLNEKIGPMLEKIEKGIEKGTANVSSTITANTPWAARPLTPIAIEELVKREKPNITREEVELMVNNRMTELMENTNETDSKLDDLINLFKEGEAKVKVNNY